MALIEKLKPGFWKTRPPSPGASKYLFNYIRIWKLSVLLTSIVVLVPLIFITVVSYTVMARGLATEYSLRTARIVSNARRTIDFFLGESITEKT